MNLAWFCMISYEVAVPSCDTPFQVAWTHQLYRGGDAKTSKVCWDQFERLGPHLEPNAGSCKLANLDRVKKSRLAMNIPV